MLRHEHRAAVLIGQDGGFIGTDRLGIGYDLLFIEADQRTENGQVHRVVGHRQALDGLTRHLADRFARHKRLRAAGEGDAFRDLHHQPAHEYRRFALGAFFVDRKLDLGKRHEI